MGDVNAKPLYEVGYHLVPTVTEEDIGAEVARIREAIESRDGSVVSEEWPKKMDLAYSIMHQEERTRTEYDSAYFGWIRFEMEKEQLSGVQETLQEMQSLLRFIVVHVPREELKPRFQKRRMRSVLSKDEEPKEEKADADKASTEEIDREIEKLVS